ncbi:MAG: hypothetical protein ACLFPA_07540 [Dichotomicrobium sp.]
MQEMADETNTAVDELAQCLQQTRAVFEQSAQIPRVASAIRALRRIETSLTRPPRIGVFGEFNSGKTSLTNILIGHKALPTSVVTSDRGSTLLRYSEQPVLYAIGGDGGRHRLTSAAFQKLIARPALTEIGVPFERLRNYEIVDSVGVSDPGMGGLPPKRAANSYVHAAVWCTVATQAWKRSEVTQWRTMPEAVRRRSLLVVTHMDAVPSPRDRERIAERIRGEAANLFHGFVMVSLTQALRAVSPEGEILDEAEWYNSGAADMEHWFAEIAEMARIDKRSHALASAKAVAERLMSAPLRSPHEIAVSRLQTAWSHRTRRIVHDAAGGREIGRMSVDQHIGALVSAARSFSAYSLEPWLEGRVKQAVMRPILALLPTDEGRLRAFLKDLDPAQAHHMLELVVEQIAAELGETLLQVTPHKSDRPVELPETVLRAAGELASWAGHAQAS